ncbi:C40 family peptidase, partial [bacterium]|nr:C40 family peptidase [bacterium]
MWKKDNIIYRIALLFIFILISCTPAPPWNPKENTRRGTQQLQPLPETKPPSHLSQEKQELLANIKQYLGVPYKWGGVDKSGMDCSGLVITVYRDVFDITLPHNSRQLSKLGSPIPRHNLTLGDLVFFRT